MLLFVGRESVGIQVCAVPAWLGQAGGCAEGSCASWELKIMAVLVFQKEKNHKKLICTLSFIKTLKIWPQEQFSGKPVQASEGHWDHGVLLIFALKCGFAVCLSS